MPLYLYCVIITINVFGLKFTKQRDIRTNRQKMIKQIVICREDSNASFLVYDGFKRRVNMTKNVFYSTRT